MSHSIFKKTGILLLCILCTTANAMAFSRSNIVSPKQGSFSNLQPLVIDGSDDYEIYYSLTGEDPMTFGLAYDGPIVIEQTGNVRLNLSAVDKDGVRKDFEIRYSVEISADDDSQEIQSLKKIKESPIYTLVSGQKLTFPTTCEVRVGEPEIRLRENVLSCSRDNLLERYTNVYVKSENQNWHFVLHVVPSRTTSLAVRSVPFEIEDWTKIKFTGDHLIYQLDDEMWIGGTEELEIDRSVPHVIRWQSVAYKPGNLVTTYRLPAKPKLIRTTKSGGIMRLSLSDDDPLYTFGGEEKNFDFGKLPRGLYQKIFFDTISGDHAQGMFDWNVYYDNVYQGKVTARISVDHRAPFEPVAITSLPGGGYSRDAVELSFESEKNATLYLAKSEPLTDPSSFAGKDQEWFNNVAYGEYEEYDGNAMLLKSLDGNATYYKFKCYSMDVIGNKSYETEYTAVVDQKNYYISSPSEKNQFVPDERAVAEGTISLSEGSFYNPFTDFSRALTVLQTKPGARLVLLDDVELGVKNYSISKDLTIDGNGHKILFNERSLVTVKDCDFNLMNATVERNGVSPNKVMFNVTSSSFVLDGCSVSSNHTGQVSLFVLENSDVNLRNSFVTVQSLSESMAVNAVNSKLAVFNCQITTVSPEATAIKTRGELTNIMGSTVNVFANKGYALYLEETKTSVSQNIFTANKINPESIIKDAYADKKCEIVLVQENVESGFEKTYDLYRNMIPEK